MIRQHLTKIISHRLIRLAAIARSKVEIATVGRTSCDSTSLGIISGLHLDDVLRSEDYASEWKRIEDEISRLSIGKEAQGVNPGDRRAIYYLVRHLRPTSALEIGTHIGASTVHISAALRTVRSLERAHRCTLRTVDIQDVNDAIALPWVAAGSTYSPIDMIGKLGCAEFVTFITQRSDRYLAHCKQTFDFVFLDGDHSPSTVYREVPAALRVLNNGGWVVLHDYFPKLRPLWSNGSVVPGPYLAVQRLRQEGADLEVVPLGRLPWSTKLGSNVTSLALLGRA